MEIRYSIDRIVVNGKLKPIESTLSALVSKRMSKLIDG